MPTVVFRRSHLYDIHLKHKDDFVMPDDKLFAAKIEELTATWAQDGVQILKAIEDESGFTWRRQEVICYVTAGVIPFSDPLTLNLRSNIDTVTHELIHCILSEPENRKKWDKGWGVIEDKYTEEPHIVKVHIIVHAIHTPILKKLFGEERYATERDSMHNPNYARAWEIVERDGYESIVAAFQ